MSVMEKSEIRVTGRVQGVGFRYAAKMLADKIGVKGGVRNCSDGSVAIEAIADSTKMANFLESLKNPPTPWAKVNNIQVRNNPNIPEVSNFEIRN
jgi:acylphosphatase